jgi:hypothetical protein
MQICFSIFFILAGLIALFAKDSAWRWQEFKNRLGGLPAERTDEWEFSRVIGGILFVIIGVISFILLTSGQ